MSATDKETVQIVAPAPSAPYKTFTQGGWGSKPSGNNPGAFLAARGRFRIGATLLEEAVELGGDSASVERRLASVWRWAGEYARIGVLRQEIDCLADTISVDHGGL